MQELRLAGIADDGEHLLLIGDGERYKLALDDELRAAVRRERRTGSEGNASTKPAAVLRPRDVQGLIRGGVPLDEIAERAGWSLEKVQRYEGPIRAERDYVAERAQAVVLPSRTETVTLRERASARLADRGVEAERVEWDSWKTDETHWTVVVRFPAGGRLREATWLFDPVDHSLRTLDDEARWLGGDELASAGEEAPEAAAKSASTQRRRQAARSGERTAKVFDVEAEGGVADAQPAHLGSALGGDDLTASMRARQASRGRASRGPRPAARPTALPVETTDVRPVEPLDVGTTPPPAPSHPRPHLVPDDAQDAQDGQETNQGAQEPKTSKRRGARRGRAGARLTEPAPVDETPVQTEELFDELPTEASETAERRGVESLRGQEATDVEEPISDEVQDADEAPATETDSDDSPTESTPVRDVPERASKARPGRPSVPSWDDIMFGGRNPKN